MAPSSGEWTGLPPAPTEPSQKRALHINRRCRVGYCRIPIRLRKRRNQPSSSSGPAARWASRRVAARPRGQQRGALARRRGSGRQQAHRRLPQLRQRRAAGVADHNAGPSMAWRCAALANLSTLKLRRREPFSRVDALLLQLRIGAASVGRCVGSCRSSVPAGALSVTRVCSRPRTQKSTSITSSASSATESPGKRAYC
jgi:hypothetical protein